MTPPHTTVYAKTPSPRSRAFFETFRGYHQQVLDEVATQSVADLVLVENIEDLPKVHNAEQIFCVLTPPEHGAAEQPSNVFVVDILHQSTEGEGVKGLLEGLRLLVIA